MSTALADQPSTAAFFFFKLTEKRRKVVKKLFYHLEKHGDIYPSVQTLSDFSGLKKRAVRDFFSQNDKMDGFFFTKSSAYDENGRQTSNSYVLNKVLVKALRWLDFHDYLNSPRSKFKKIISSMKKAENCTLPPSKTAPLYKDYSYRDRRQDTSALGTGGLNKKFEKKRDCEKNIITIPKKIDEMDLPYELKLKLSMVPEACFQNALESARWKNSNGWRIDDLKNYVAGSAIKMAQNQGIRLDWKAYYATLENYKSGKSQCF